jgi:hypothetical protein
MRRAGARRAVAVEAWGGAMTGERIVAVRGGAMTGERIVAVRGGAMTGEPSSRRGAAR